MERPSIYEYAGGEPAFLTLAAKHHERCLADPELNHPFTHSDTHPRHIERLAAYWGEVFGGPAAYPGGHSAMLLVHACEEIPEGWDRLFADCFAGALDDAGFPEDARQEMVKYMDWAVAEVNRYSAKGSQVPANLPTPKWGWDGLTG
jgi:hemoglobin